MSLRLHVAADAASLAQEAARFVVAALSRRDAERYAICLSGGHTPRATYEYLARQQLPWHKLHVFFGDERHVAQDDPRSNARMAREAFLGPAGVPEANIHAVPTRGLDPEASAAAYDAELARFFGRADPAAPGDGFDVVLLGLGDDGHTASLFPGNPVLDTRGRWAAAVHDPSVPEARVTLTLPALAASRHTAFLIEGAGKRDVLARLRAGDTRLPAARVAPSRTGLDAFVDAAAAGEETR